jgi:hypothetical protein
MNTGGQSDVPEYGFSPGPPLMWDEFPMNAQDFVPAYQEPDPVGILVREPQNPRPDLNDFDIPRPVSSVSLTPSGGQPASRTSQPVQRSARSTSISTSQSAAKRKAELELERRDTEEEEADPAPQDEMFGQSPRRYSDTQSPNAMSPTNDGPQALPVSSAPPNSTSHKTSDRRDSPPPAAKLAGDGPPPEKRQKTDRGASETSVSSSRQVGGGGRLRRILEAPKDTSSVLPAGKVFPIQIGPELFRLSGASISSDGRTIVTQ